MAFLGGIILNFMPCIFPILSIKVISLANMSNEERGIEALFYTIGVVTSMLVIASILYSFENEKFSIVINIVVKCAYFEKKS